MTKTSKTIARAGEVVRVPDVGSHVAAWPTITHPTGGPGRWGVIAARKNAHTHVISPIARFLSRGDVGALSGIPCTVIGDLTTPVDARAEAERRYASAVRDYDLQVRAGIDVRGERPKRPAWLD